MKAYHQLTVGLGMLLCICLQIGVAADRSIYMWKDAEGNVHYGDYPQSEDAVELEVKPGKSTPAPATTPLKRKEQQRRLLQAMEDDRRQLDQQRAEEKQQRAEAQAKCNRARDQLRQITTSQYLYDLNDKGERVVLSDVERKQYTTRAEAEAKRWCSDG